MRAAQKRKHAAIDRALKEAGFSAVYGELVTRDGAHWQHARTIIPWVNTHGLVIHRERPVNGVRVYSDLGYIAGQ